MGYAITMTATVEAEVLDTTLTFNYRPALIRALGADGLMSLDGYAGWGVGQALDRAIKHINDNWEEYALILKDTPESVFGLTEVLTEIRDVCSKHPDEMLKVWR